MEPTPHIAAHWALFSKNPGVTMEYDILASTFDRGEALRRVRSGLTGHPESEAAGQPEALPWLVFLGGTVDDPAFPVMAMTWSEERDGTHQPIAPSRLMLLDWDAAAREQLTFEGAARGFFNLQWTEVTQGPPQSQGAQPIALRPVSDVDSRTVADRIDNELGFDWVAQIAATLLDGGQVVITATDAFPTVAKRIEILDAICALLPYGYRAQLSAATWAGYRITHAVRLTFATRARAGQNHAQLGGAVPAPVGVAPASYLRHLLNLHHHKGISTARLVEHLAAQTIATGARTPQDCIERLLDVDLPSAVYEAIMEGRGRLDQLARVLAGAGWAAWDEPHRAVCIRWLGEGALREDPAAGGLALRLVRETWSDDVAVVLGRDAANDLARDSTALLTAWAERVGPQAMAMIVTAMTATIADHGPVAARLRLGRLLWESPPGLSMWDADVHTVFLRRPAAAVGLLIQTHEYGPERVSTLVTHWFRLYAPTGGNWLRPLVLALGVAGPEVSTADIEALRQVWPNGILVAFQAALTGGRIDQLAPVMWQELTRSTAAALDHNDQARVESIEALLRSAPTRGIGDVAAARLDLLFLSVLAELPVVTATGYRPSASYRSEFSEQWASPQIQSRRPTNVRYAAQALSEPGALAYLMDLADHLDPALREGAVNAISEHLRVSPHRWQDLPLTGQWPRWVGGWVEWMCVLDTRAQPGGDPAEVADACTNAFGYNVNVSLLDSFIWRWSARDPRRLVELSLALSRIHNPPHLGQYAAGVRDHLAGLVARNHLGETVDHESQFVVQATAAFAANIRQHTAATRPPPPPGQVLAIAGAPGGGGAPIVPPAPTIAPPPAISPPPATTPPPVIPEPPRFASAPPADDPTDGKKKGPLAWASGLVNRGKGEPANARPQDTSADATTQVSHDRESR